MRRFTITHAYLLLGSFLLFSTSLRAQPDRRSDTSGFSLVNLTAVNSPADDYGPYVTPSGKWFYLTSSREGSTNLYRSRRVSGGWAQPEPPNSADVNGPRDEGSLSAPFPRIAQLFELTDEELRSIAIPEVGVFTTSKRPDGEGDADIYLVDVTYDGATLNDLQALPAINSSDWDAQGSIAPDGSFIIFASTRSGGEGGMDLYISTRTAGGGFSEPVELGDVINTGDNEFSPFIAPDGRTLYFASTGHPGFGGSDIFLSQRDAAGRWSAPVNLGERINTSANELFFFGVGRSRCYFASDRAGGRGGLDIYEATPNVFARGYSTVKVTFPDTTTGRQLSGRVKVVETSLGRTVAELDVDALRGGSIDLIAGLSYRVVASVPGFPEEVAHLNDIPADTTVSFVMKFGSVPAPPPPPPPPPVKPAFTFEDVTAPFFVSGYYRLNTKQSLEDLRKRQTDGDLKSQTFIADVARDASAYEQNARSAGKVEEILNRFTKAALEEYFPNFFEEMRTKKPGDPKEYIELTVYGFADPRPIIGTYSEEPVTFLDSNNREVRVDRGEALDNFKLAGLRAHYAVEHFDNIFRNARRGGKEYIALMQQGLIRWRAVSGDVERIPGVADLATMRRIMVHVRTVREGR